MRISKNVIFLPILFFLMTGASLPSMVKAAGVGVGGAGPYQAVNASGLAGTISDPKAGYPIGNAAPSADPAGITDSGPSHMLWHATPDGTRSEPNGGRLAADGARYEVVRSFDAMAQGQALKELPLGAEGAKQGKLEGHAGEYRQATGYYPNPQVGRSGGKDSTYPDAFGNSQSLGGGSSIAYAGEAAADSRGMALGKDAGAASRFEPAENPSGTQLLPRGVEIRSLTGGSGVHSNLIHGLGDLKGVALYGGVYATGVPTVSKGLPASNVTVSVPWAAPGQGNPPATASYANPA